MANQKQKKQASPKKEQKNNTSLSGEINREYLGKTLLDAGFEVWFRYMFRVLEGKPFIIDRIHKDMFNVFDDLYNLRITRECMNIPPRAGKTTLCKYWLIYCLTKNPRCNFIYTSFSQMLLSDIAREVAQILEHPIYKELYGNGLYGVEEKEENPIDDFWREYLLKETGRAVYASKRIITAKGGQILFASIGSTITGFGCFDYNTEVLTEKGFMKLGYIVENKIDVKVWSYNFDKRQKELQPIYDYVKNENSPYMEIELDNGEKINCTPDHVFYLKNGEERRADFLSVGSEIMSNKFGNRKIVNIVNCNHSAPSYCVTLWNNNNLFITKSQVLVHNCGIRGTKGFSGALIIDDANKPADIMSETMRDKVRKYYDETLLSRLNDSNVPIFNIQQRLHLGDLSGYLLEQYKFDSIVKPLLEPDGTCNIASQYTPERIKEISFNDTMFQAQYQQSPVAEKGNIIQRDWWVMYDADHTPIDGKLIITADTAYKKTKTADYSCFQVWELLRKEMRLRDMIVGKWEFPELLEKATQIWRKWTDDSLINPAAFMYIEDKASGISLEQTLIQSGINAICWKPKEYDYPEDKVGRTRELSWDVYRGLVKLKKDDKMSQYLVNEAALFAEDMSHAHDDSCFVAGTKVATIFGDKNIEELKVGDLVITPWGVSPITRTTSRMKPVIDNIGLTGTKDHKIYTTHDYSFDSLENVDYSMVSKLTIEELISWQIKSLYCSMAKNTILTQRQDIMKIKSLLTEKEKHSGFIGLFMNFIREKKFLKAITFITKTKIKIITTLAIWCFYHTANTLNFMAKKPLKFGKDLKCKKQIKEVEKCAKSGIAQKREEIGTQNIKKNTLPNFILLKYVPIAEEDLIPQTTTESRQYVDGVEISTLKENYAGKPKKRVYNITVRAGCYYANNILVSNCDAASMAHSIWRYAGGGQ
jgi:predicted phage terminase large subunit-like protein